MDASDKLRPPRERGLPRALVFALLVHLLLIALLTVGVHWHSHEPDAVEAELWAPTAHLAAPRPPRVQAQPVVPQPRPAPPPPPPPPQVAPQPSPDEAQIALQRKKLAQQRKLEAQQQLAAERREQQKLAAEQLAAEKLAAKKLAARKLAEEKRAERKLAEQKQREQQREQEKELEAQKKLAQQKKLAEQKAAEEKAAEKKVAEEKAAKLKAAKEKAERLAAERRQEQQLAKLQQQSRQDYMKSLMAQAGDGPAGSTGTAARSSGPSGSYGARLATLVRQNTVYPQIAQVQGNPQVLLTVTLDTNNGTIINVRIKHSSGVPSWDEAAKRAVERVGRFPSDHGQWYSPMDVQAGPRDHR